MSLPGDKGIAAAAARNNTTSPSDREYGAGSDGTLRHRHHPSAASFHQECTTAVNGVVSASLTAVTVGDLVGRHA